MMNGNPEEEKGGSPASEREGKPRSGKDGILAKISVFLFIMSCAGVAGGIFAVILPYGGHHRGINWQFMMNERMSDLKMRFFFGAGAGAVIGAIWLWNTLRKT